MAIVASDSCRLRVGDGNVSELFLALDGAEVKRLELSQALVEDTAIRSHNWQVQAAPVARGVTVECTALVTTSAAHTRLRALALAGTSGNFELDMDASHELTFAGYVNLYRETQQAGGLTRVDVRITSSGTISYG